MIREDISSTLQNKNAVMFITAIIFMAGILSYFNNCEILICGIISSIGIVLLLQKKLTIKYVLFWIFIFYLGFFSALFRTKTNDELYNIAPANALLTGQIISIPNITNSKTRFFFRVSKINDKQIDGKTYITIDGQYHNFNVGDYYKIESRIRRPFKASNPSQFDYGKYLKNFNTFTTTYAKISDCKKLSPPTEFQWKFLQSLNQVRNNIIETHAKYLKSPNLEILGGIVFGDDAVAPPDYIKSTFVNSGLLHILAASGMNVAFIFGFWFVIMRFFRVPYKVNIVGGMIMVILYTMMTGLGASVLRAALMLLFIQLGKLIDRDADSVSLLAFVAFLLLLYNPAYINDVGFQLSFLVTFGLLTTAKVIFDKMSEIKLPEWLKAGILIPVIAQIWVAPIQMFYFNTFSTYSIFANIVTVPFLSVISFGGFVSSILASIKPISNFVCMVFDFVLKYMLDIVVLISNYFSQMPHSLISTTHPNVLQIFLYYAIVLLFTLAIKSGFNKKIFITVGTACIILLISLIHIPNHKLEIIAFDVQNADAFLIKTPGNKYFIIDTAKLSYKSNNSTARLVIIKYLKDRGIKNIEGMILTHFDLDHAGGAVDLMNELDIQKVYVNSLNHDSFIVDNIFATFKKLDITPVLAKNNEKIYCENNMQIKTFIANIPNNDNENSIITLVSYKNFDMLFMGDAGFMAFNKIKSNILHNIEVLKVGHHGGKNVVNNEMLNYLHNNISVISTGPNTFGHPLKSTLDILRNTNIYRTDKHNSIKISTDGNTYNIYTFNRLNKKYKQTQSLKTISE